MSATDWSPWAHKVLAQLSTSSTVTGTAFHLSDAGSHSLNTFLEDIFDVICGECRRTSALLNVCGPPEVRTALRLLLHGDLCARSIKAASSALMKLLHPPRSTLYSAGPRASQCGLVFPVGRTQHLMTAAQVSSRIDVGAAVVIAAVLEFLCGELLRYACDHALQLRAQSGGDRREATTLTLDALHIEHATTSQPAFGVFVAAKSPPDLATLPRPHMGSPSSLVLRRMKLAVDRCMYHLGLSDRNVAWEEDAVVHVFYYARLQSFPDGSSLSESTDLDELVTAHTPGPLSAFCYPGLSLLQSLVRAAVICGEHMGRTTVHVDDVLDAARVLRLTDTPPRWGIGAAWHTPGPPSAGPEHLIIMTCFQTLHAGRAEAVPVIVEMLRTHKLSLDVRGPYGLTLLMGACIRGDAASARALLSEGADVNATLMPSVLLPPAWERLKGFTALHFAILYRHVHVVRTLLQLGASVEGLAGGLEAAPAHVHFSTFFEPDVMVRCLDSLPPLHLAAWAGDASIVHELLLSGASAHRKAAGARGSFNAVTFAAMGGHLTVLHMLLQPGNLASGPSTGHSQLLTLQEILAEGAGSPAPHGPTPLSPSPHAPAPTPAPAAAHALVFGPAPRSPPSALGGNLTAGGLATMGNLGQALTGLGMQHVITRPTVFVERSDLAEALFTSVENEYFEIALELHRLGVRWSMYLWAQVLRLAWAAGRADVINELLVDYIRCRYDDFYVEFVGDDVALLFKILRSSADGDLFIRCAEVISLLWHLARVPVEGLPRNREQLDDKQPGLQIGRQYVNSQELSDVTFKVEGRPFFAHKIILVTASERFKQLLTGPFAESRQAEITLEDVKYDTFRLMIEFVYSGSTAFLEHKPWDVLLDLLIAADYFLLHSLLSRCEPLLSRTLTIANAMPIYRCALDHNAILLARSCEQFFAAHLLALAPEPSFRALLFDEESYLLMRLQELLSETIVERVRLVAALARAV
eukprot:m.175941 g.175941  ORF g.175941 m.175941 type:complete len:979 (-) comp15337_c7_seq1:46-2982(-)